MKVSEATFARLNSEVRTVVRITGKSSQEVIYAVIEWMDYQFYGVVPVPLEASQPEGRGLEE